MRPWVYIAVTEGTALTDSALDATVARDTNDVSLGYKMSSHSRHNNVIDT